MKSGMRRKVDDLGRVVIPAGMRRSLGIREGDALEVSVRGDEVILSKLVDRCVFCHSDQELHSFRDKAICARCAAAVATLDHAEEAAVHEGGLRIVRGEATTAAAHREPPASTTAW